MQRLEKKEGNIGPCWKCGKQIFCRMTVSSDKYPSKLQWQEHIEGTNPPTYQSHYMFDIKTNESSCRGQDELPPQNQQLPIEPKSVEVRKVTELDQKVEAKLEKEYHDRGLLKAAGFRGIELLGKELGINNGAVLGLLFKAVDREFNSVDREE